MDTTTRVIGFSECAWCGTDVPEYGDTCSEWCYRRWITTHCGVIADDVIVPKQYDTQDWWEK